MGAAGAGWLRQVEKGVGALDTEGSIGFKWGWLRSSWETRVPADELAPLQPLCHISYFQQCEVPCLQAPWPHCTRVGAGPGATQAPQPALLFSHPQVSGPWEGSLSRAKPRGGWWSRLMISGTMEVCRMARPRSAMQGHLASPWAGQLGEGL